MTEAMPFLQKTILLSYDPRSFASGIFPQNACPGAMSEHASFYF